MALQATPMACPAAANSPRLVRTASVLPSHGALTTRKSFDYNTLHEFYTFERTAKCLFIRQIEHFVTTCFSSSV